MVEGYVVVCVMVDEDNSAGCINRISVAGGIEAMTLNKPIRVKGGGKMSYKESRQNRVEKKS